MRGLIGILLWTFGGGVAVATALGLLDRLNLGEAGWLFDLAAHFPRQVAAVALATALAAGALKAWRPAAVAAAAAAINLALVLGVSGYALPQAAPAGAPVVRIVSANVHGSREALTRLSELARAYGADLVAVYEAPDISEEGMAALFPEAPMRRLASASPDGRAISKRMLFAARAPGVGQIAMAPYGRSNRVILRFTLPMGDTSVRIVMAHPVSPDSPAGMRDRDLLLSHVADGLPLDEPFVAMGDFNTSPWGHAYALVPGARAGDPRFDSTFPSGFPVLGIPIDHMKFGGRLTVTEYHVGPDIGSDHRPLFATFALNGN
jgi:endonuclease/exonuclease/phosphatase (EEP) superfamily protein YafD